MYERLVELTAVMRNVTFDDMKLPCLDDRRSLKTARILNTTKECDISRMERLDLIIRYNGLMPRIHCFWAPHSSRYIGRVSLLLGSNEPGNINSPVWYVLSSSSKSPGRENRIFVSLAQLLNALTGLTTIK